MPFSLTLWKTQFIFELHAIFLYYIFWSAPILLFDWYYLAEIQSTAINHHTECGKCYFIPALGIFSDSPKKLIAGFRDIKLINPMTSVKELYVAPNTAWLLLLRYLCVVSSLWAMVGTFQNSTCFSDADANSTAACNLKNIPLQSESMHTCNTALRFSVPYCL